jgi:hypothetical protein
MVRRVRADYAEANAVLHSSIQFKLLPQLAQLRNVRSFIRTHVGAAHSNPLSMEAREPVEGEAVFLANISDQPVRDLIAVQRVIEQLRDVAGSVREIGPGRVKSCSDVDCTML